MINTNKMEEIWKVIDGYKNYEISNLGRVKNITTKNILKSASKNGYCYNNLQDENKKEKAFRVHRLVATTFITNDDPKNKTQVNHINGDKTNNCVNNLEWISASDNIKHAIDTKLLKTQARKVQQYTKDGTFVKTYNSIAEAGKELGIAPDSICSVCKGVKFHNTAGGFIWKYEDADILCKEQATEELTPIKDYPLYAITKTGKIYSHKRKRYLCPSDIDGYSRVHLSDGTKVKSYMIHRLVAETFIPNPDNKPEVNHKNKDRKDNTVENLEWMTSKENTKHAKQSTKIIVKSKSNKTNQQVSNNTKL